jgi:ABC-type multidrug transport system ATPase subunit
VGILIAITVAYALIAAVGSEIMTFSSQGGGQIVYTRKPATAVQRGEGAQADVEKSAAVEGDNLALKPSTGGPALAWTDFTVDIGETRVIKDISAYLRPGDFIALCGASGAGKTTLLSALSQTSSVGVVGGSVTFGRSAVEQLNIGFAQQMDLHDGSATIREAFIFSALLRQPSYYTKQEKIAFADSVIDMLDLRPYQDALVGDMTNGLSLGVEITKRVTVGVELAARPKILFVDEPTSGLDSQSATHIVSLLRRLATQGQAVIVTIHQPSASVFQQFDRLLALSSDGRQIYFGDSKEVVPYFARNGAQCPEDANVAEFVLETVGAGIKAKTEGGGQSTVWADVWQASPEAQQILADIHALRASGPEQPDDQPANATASDLTQTLLLTQRILRNQWRNTNYMYSKIWVHVVCGLLAGFTFYNLGTSPSDLQNRLFSVFFIVFLVNSIVNTILARFFFARLFWEYREGPSKTYGWVALCAASILAELPGALVCGLLYWVLWYWPSGLPGGGTAGYVFLVVLTYEVFQVCLPPTLLSFPELCTSNAANR